MAGRWGGVKYTTVEWAPKHIANMCQRRGVAGGYYEFWDVGVRVRGGVLGMYRGMNSWQGNLLHVSYIGTALVVDTCASGYNKA